MTRDELAEFANKAIAGSFSSQIAALEKTFVEAMFTGTGATRMSVDSLAYVESEKRRWGGVPPKFVAWGERFEVSKTGKVKKNKRAPVLGTYDMEANFSPIWDDTLWPKLNVSSQCHFMTALQDLNRNGSYEANRVMRLNFVQRQLFIERVKNSKVRTLFLDLVFARAVALRMGGE